MGELSNVSLLLIFHQNIYNSSYYMYVSMKYVYHTIYVCGYIRKYVDFTLPVCDLKDSGVVGTIDRFSLLCLNDF